MNKILKKITNDSRRLLILQLEHEGEAKIKNLKEYIREQQSTLNLKNTEKIVDKSKFWTTNSNIG